MIMWSPWHGCKKISEGCQNCYMYYLDKIREKDGSVIYKTKSNFYLPVMKDRQGNYTVKSGTTLATCMSSDFFLEEADEWRKEVWQMIRERSDVKFFIITKRAHRIAKCLPPDWKDGYENVMINVTAENQKRADERLPVFLNIPMKHKGIACSPFIERVDISKYLESGQIEEVSCGGENYESPRVCDFEWVKDLRAQCVRNNVNFLFFETGTNFRKDGRIYHLPSKKIQSEMAHKSGMNYIAKETEYNLCDKMGIPIPKMKSENKYKERCKSCAYRYTSCDGCSDCGKCK